ncbi:MAG: hypothetical protein OXI23_05260 [Gemmatimonadota bacterium]|nr:hypothetical protein [Gemmatimonadota bacterium]
MARDLSVSVRLNAAEYWYLRRYATEQDKDMSQMLRSILHGYIIDQEGEAAALRLLQGQPPE